MQEISAVKFEIKRSRFFAHIYLIESTADYFVVNSLHRKMYKKAAHHCSAMNFKDEDGRIFQEFKNDGEVGRPGRALLSLLENEGLGSHAIVVSRVFGGIKLGPAGVTRAFRKSGEAAAEMCLKDR